MTVRRHEVGSYEAVAVEEDAIRTRARENRAISNLGQAKSAILMPHVLEWNGHVRPTLNGARGCGIGAVISHHHFELPICLAR